MIVEYSRYRRLANLFPESFTLETLDHVCGTREEYPIYGFELCTQKGSPELRRKLPTLGLFAGIHGLEAIGVKILLNFLEHLLEQTAWNDTLNELLSKMRIVGLPIVNPVGLAEKTRSNGRGVDLMRNSPIQSSEQLSFIGGQSLTPRLPYFRGFGVLEKENEALIRFVRENLLGSPFSISLDLHSGFGLKDFLWTPYAKKRGQPPTWARYERIRDLLDRSLTYHVYKFEVQSDTYCTSGDVWDYLYDEQIEKFGANSNIFLPLTLEVGSWVWLRKAPYKAFRIQNFFNPAHEHREKRVLRRHRPLLEFLMHLTAHHGSVF